MTRINTIPPQELNFKHLFSEYREIPRIATAVLKYVHLGREIPEQPDKFCLGAGHVTFFYDKIQFLHKRFLELKKELEKRKPGIQLSITDSQFTALRESKYYNDWQPTEESKRLIRERIKERLKA